MLMTMLINRTTGAVEVGTTHQFIGTRFVQCRLERSIRVRAAPSVL